MCTYFVLRCDYLIWRKVKGNRNILPFCLLIFYSWLLLVYHFSLTSSFILCLLLDQWIIRSPCDEDKMMIFGLSHMGGWREETKGEERWWRGKFFC